MLTKMLLDWRRIMREIQKRMLIQICLGFLLGRVDLFGMNPIGIAFFAAGYALEGAKFPVAVSVLMGMLTVFPIEIVVSSGMAMLAMVLTVDVLHRRKIEVKSAYIAMLITVAKGALTAFYLYLMPHDQYALWLGVCETVLVFVMTRVFYESVRFMLYAKNGQDVSDETIISLVFFGGFSLLGVPNIAIMHISVIQCVVFLLTLVAGFCFGIGAGSVTGAMGGCVLLANGAESYVIGILALLGICIGMLREQGKILAGVSFSILAMVLFYVVEMSFSGMGNIEESLIASSLFILFPERLLWKISLLSRNSSKEWESSCMQKMMQHKLEDFATYFQRLGAILMKGTMTENAVEPGEMSRLLEGMSEQVCGRCENASVCRGLIALFRPEMLTTLSEAKAQGQLMLDKMPTAFVRECIHKERFLSEANQCIHLANMALGYQNRMNQSQRIIAQQMKEVGNIVTTLSDRLPVAQKLPEELTEQIARTLRRKRVLLSEIAFYEKCDERLEVHIKGRTYRGRFVTTREVGEVLSDAIGRTVLPREECRKVFSHAEEAFVFEEGAKLTAVTGISRRPKQGERLSGDTFSSTYLPSGELLVALSDGMGSGDEASMESERVIELLEQMTEIGFSEMTALRLINSIYISKEDSGNFATADIALLNLHQKTCQFVKCGASVTYLCHRGEVTEIQGEALPIGVMTDLEPYTRKSGINSGDYVIMMTDGVADSFDAEIAELENIIEEEFERKSGPKEMADYILAEAIDHLHGECSDDMSVLVVKIYDNLNARCRMPWTRRQKNVS